jgi:hypothetical protein
MKDSYLEVTYRHGRPIAAYLYLPRDTDEKSTRTKRIEPGMVIDFGPNDRAIGIEITAPSALSPGDLNRVLADLGLAPLAGSDLGPLQAA